MVRALVAATFFVLLLAPERWSLVSVLVCLAVVGFWSLMFPQGILGWAKTAHPTIDVDDRSIWWVPRLIGSCFIGLALLISIVAMAR